MMLLWHRVPFSSLLTRQCRSYYGRQSTVIIRKEARPQRQNNNCKCFFSSSSSPRNKSNKLSRAQQLQGDASLAFGRALVTGVALLSGGISAIIMAQAEPAARDNSTSSYYDGQDDDAHLNLHLLEPLRSESFDLTAHSNQAVLHFLKVNRNNDNNDPMHTVQDYTVKITLFSSEAEDSFISGDNRCIITRDAQQNMVAVLAKKYSFDSPEELGMIAAQFILLQYPWLDAVDIHVDETIWNRVRVDAQSHPHGFARKSPFVNHASVHLARGQGPIISSSVSNLVLLKTSQSGFEGFHRDKFTSLVDTSERCMSTELEAVWTYVPVSFHQVDHRLLRRNIRKLIHKGFFGLPSTNGLYSPSLQATLYDTACVILGEEPHVQTVSFHAKDVDYTPIASIFEHVHEVANENSANDHDVFIASHHPSSGTITCTVNRGHAITTVKKQPSLLVSSSSDEQQTPRPVRLQPQRSKLPNN